MILQMMVGSFVYLIFHCVLLHHKVALQQQQQQQHLDDENNKRQDIVKFMAWFQCKKLIHIIALFLKRIYIDSFQWIPTWECFDIFVQDLSDKCIWSVTTAIDRRFYCILFGLKLSLTGKRTMSKLPNVYICLMNCWYFSWILFKVCCGSITFWKRWFGLHEWNELA